MRHRGAHDEPWSPDEVARLRALHAEGLGPMAISQELGRSRNAVIGKRRRLKLSPRTPAQQQATAKQPRRAGKVTLPVLGSLG